MKRHTRPNPQKNIKGGIVEKEGPHQRFQRDGGLRQLRKAYPHRTHDPAGRHQSAQLPPLQHHAGQVSDLNLRTRRKKAMKSRLQEKYRSETVPALMKRFGWKNNMAVPKLQKITVNIGLGEASQNAKLLDTAARGTRPDHRAKGHHHARQEVHRQLQNPQGHAHRLRGHAARRQDVRISRPSVQRGSAARPRFSRLALRTPSMAAAITRSA